MVLHEFYCRTGCIHLPVGLIVLVPISDGILLRVLKFVPGSEFRPSSPVDEGSPNRVDICAGYRVEKSQ